MLPEATVNRYQNETKFASRTKHDIPETGERGVVAICCDQTAFCCWHYSFLWHVLYLSMGIETQNNETYLFNLSSLLVAKRKSVTMLSCRLYFPVGLRTSWQIQEQLDLSVLEIEQCCFLCRSGKGKICMQWVNPKFSGESRKVCWENPFTFKNLEKARLSHAVYREAWSLLAARSRKCTQEGKSVGQ